MDINVRMKYWDRKFKTLLSYPQVSGEAPPATRGQ